MHLDDESINCCRAYSTRKEKSEDEPRYDWPFGPEMHYPHDKDGYQRQSSQDDGHEGRILPCTTIIDASEPLRKVTIADVQLSCRDLRQSISYAMGEPTTSGW